MPKKHSANKSASKLTHIDRGASGTDTSHVTKNLSQDFSAVVGGVGEKAARGDTPTAHPPKDKGAKEAETKGGTPKRGRKGKGSQEKEDVVIGTPKAGNQAESSNVINLGKRKASDSAGKTTGEESTSKTHTGGEGGDKDKASLEPALAKKVKTNNEDVKNQYGQEAGHKAEDKGREKAERMEEEPSAAQITQAVASHGAFNVSGGWKCYVNHSTTRTYENAAKAASEALHGKYPQLEVNLVKAPEKHNLFEVVLKKGTGGDTVVYSKEKGDPLPTKRSAEKLLGKITKTIGEEVSHLAEKKQEEKKDTPTRGRKSGKKEQEEEEQTTSKKAETTPTKAETTPTKAETTPTKAEKATSPKAAATTTSPEKKTTPGRGKGSAKKTDKNKAQEAQQVSTTSQESTNKQEEGTKQEQSEQQESSKQNQSQDQTQEQEQARDPQQQTDPIDPPEPTTTAIDDTGHKDQIHDTHENDTQQHHEHDIHQPHELDPHHSVHSIGKMTHGEMENLGISGITTAGGFSTTAMPEPIAPGLNRTASHDFGIPRHVEHVPFAQEAQNIDTKEINAPTEKQQDNEDKDQENREGVEEGDPKTVNDDPVPIGGPPIEMDIGGNKELRNEEEAGDNADYPTRDPGAVISGNRGFLGVASGDGV